MQWKKVPWLFFLVLILGFTSCNSEVYPSEQNSRILGMDVKPKPSEPQASAYSMAYAEAMAMGVREVKMSLDWASGEPAVGAYDDTVPGIINIFYPGQPAYFTLVLRPLDTPGPSLPSDLAGKAYDDAEVIQAFNNYLTHLHSVLPDLNESGKLKWIQVGNEIDAYLGSDAGRWAEWQIFFDAAKARIKELWGDDVEVGSIVQFSTLSDSTKLPLYLNLLPSLDNAVLNYYPLKADFTMRPVSTVAADFDTMASTIPGKPIILQECGYPSSTVNNSSESIQADFISAVFDAWDTYADRFPLIDFTWQYDVSPGQVDDWVTAYGMAGSVHEAAFRAYLGTLGFGNHDGSEKQAMQRIRDELHRYSF